MVPISRSGRRGDLLPTREAERAPSRREIDATDRPSAPERRARRRRQREGWLRRNALSIAALAILVAILAVGFAMLQLLTHSTPAGETQASATSAPALTPAVGPTAVSATNGSGAAPAEATTAASGPREVRTSVKALEPNYTVQAGDSLAKIATRFNTTIQRIQALNNLANPRVLSVGQKLVVPPPL